MTIVLTDRIGSRELAERAGVSYRRLDYWTRRGMLEVIGHPTPGQGQQRLYRSREIAVARFLDFVVPWQDAPGSRLTSDRVRGICEYIRLDGRGTIQLVRGVTVDLDRICDET